MNTFCSFLVLYTSGGSRGEARGPRVPYFGYKKIAEGRKAGRASKKPHTTTPPLLSSRSGSATEYKLESKTCHYSANAATSYYTLLVT